MNPSSPQPGFPAFKAITALTGATAGLLGAALLATRGLGGERVAANTVLFAAGVAWLSALAGLCPVAVLGRRGVMPTVYGYFGGMGLRLVLCFAPAMVAVHGGYLPGRPVAIALSVFYLPLLAIEMAFVGPYLWQKDLLGRPAAPPAQRPEATA